MKRGRGRPALDPRDKRMVTSFTVSPDVLEQIDRAAEEAGETRSDWILDACEAKLHATFRLGNRDA